MLLFLKNLPKTFYSAPFYRDLLLAGKGFGLGFVLVVTLITAGQVGFLLHKPLSALAHEQAALFEALPVLEIKDGVLHAEGESPKIIEVMKGNEAGSFFVVVDTDNEALDEAALSKKMVEERILLLVNKNAVSFLNPETQLVETTRTEKNKDNIITHEKWIKFGNQLVSIIVPLMLLLTIVLLFILQVLVALMGAVLLFIVAPLFKVTVDFRALTRLSAAASVPLTIVFLFLTPNPTLQVLLWFGFAAFGLLASKTPFPKSESAP